MSKGGLCSFPECDRPVLCRALCKGHYRQTLRGRPLGPLKKQDGSATRLAKEFLASIPDTNECVDWSFLQKEGYGRFTEGSLWRMAHVVSCEAAHGPRPFPGAYAAHRCGRSICVNPAHLRWATPRENKHDMIAHGTAFKKLTKEKILEIRSSAESSGVLAERMSCSRWTINAVRKRILWATI